LFNSNMTDQTGTPAVGANSATKLGNDASMSDLLNKRVIVHSHGGEREIKMLVVVENFRLAFYLGFFFLTLVGVLLTNTFVEEDDPGAFLRDIFGVVTICVYYDFAPSNYVLPSLWSLTLIFIEAYTIVWIFRVWIAMEEQHVSRCAFVGYCIGFSYVFLSFHFFSTIFAVSPDTEEESTMSIHTIPYINLQVALWVMAVMVTKFGDQVAWKHMGLPCWFSNTNYVVICIQSFATVCKMVNTFNCLSDMNGGLWWDPSNETVMDFISVINQFFLLSTFIYPTFQSAYLSRKGRKTHCVVMSLQDNRKSGIVEAEMGTNLSHTDVEIVRNQ